MRNDDLTLQELIVRAAGKQIYTDRIVLKPMEVYEKRVPASVKKGELRVEVGDKLSYTDDPNADLFADATREAGATLLTYGIARC